MIMAAMLCAPGDLYELGQPELPDKVQGLGADLQPRQVRCPGNLELG